MKKNLFKKAVSMALSLACLFSLAVNASASSIEASDTPTSIPVQLSAEATHFSVTLPTALPTTVDSGTGETSTASNADITNNSPGSVRVTQIVIINKKQEKFSVVSTR